MREDKLLEFYISILLVIPSKLVYLIERLFPLNYEGNHNNPRKLGNFKNAMFRKRHFALTMPILF